MSEHDLAGQDEKPGTSTTSGKGGKSVKLGKASRSGNPATRGRDKAAVQQQKLTFDPDRGPALSVRFVVAVALMVVGIAWVVFYYVGVTPPNQFGDQGQPLTPSGPGFMQDLGNWNYLIGFGALFLGLAASANPKTPLGRGRAVVVMMLGCFLVGLAWICTYYAIAQDPNLPIFDDLQQKNLFVGIGFMAVGFFFATRWE